MDFTNLAFNPLSKMNEIIRYSSVYQETEETLGEHVTETLMMSYLIARHIVKITNGEEKVDIGVLLEKALLHDADETLTGDIPRNTKYATSAAHHQLNIVAEEAIEMIDAMTGLPISKVWEHAKEGKEGLILKIVDMLVVVKKAVTEVELRGNLTFLKVVSELEDHLTTMISHLKEKGEKSFDTDLASNYILDLVGQAKDEITTIRVKYSHIIKKYMIQENVIKGGI